MKPFTYSTAVDPSTAIDLLARHANAKFLGGGTNLVDLMREQIETPAMLVDVSRMPFTQIETSANDRLSIGAAVRNTALATHPLVRKRYPVLSQAILCGASGQIRNMATVGGNLMQRTRCPYFYDGSANCNKRTPNSGCDAIHGFNRMHAILGASPSCIATHPSDMCVALSALEATVLVHGPLGARTIPFDAFHRLPGATPAVETDLRPGELITSVEIPPLDGAAHSLYRKIRDRASYAFALVSVAAIVALEDGAIVNARIALGGVAHKPWRAFEAERLLVGASATESVFRQAADAELRPARGYGHNDFKIELAKRTLVSVLGELTGTRGAQ